MEQDKKYISYFDILNIIACFGVVALHVNAKFWNFTGDRRWITSNIIECVFYPAVPIFFMLTGANLMDYRKRYGTREFFKKRFVKTVIPWLIWSGISLIWAVFFIHRLAPSDVNNPLKIIDAVINSKGNSVYWFFPMLFSTYLGIPVISMVPEDRRNRVFGYIVGTELVCTTILPFICRLLGIQWNDAFTSPICTGALMMTMLGYMAANNEIPKKWRRIIYILGICGLFAHILGTMYVSFKAGDIVNTFKGYWNVPCMLYTMAIFVFFKYHRFRIPVFNNKKLLRSIAGASFGIYLIHYYFIDIFLRLFHTSGESWQWRIFGTFLVYGISLATVLIMKKIPVLKKIVP